MGSVVLQVTVAMSLALAALAAGEASAKGPPPHAGKEEEEQEEEGRGPPHKRPPPHVVLSSAGVAPVIDGRLDDQAWDFAVVVDEFTQVEPDEGEDPTRRTEVLITYDANFLYLGVRAFGDAGSIIARELRHDTDFESDDHVAFVLDTFSSGRNAYRMRVNPLGAKSEGLVEASKDVGDEWDGIWYAKTSIGPDAWFAEIAIPFKTVSFNRNISEWRFNFERVIRDRNEVVRWTALRGGRGLNDIDQAGYLDNMVGLNKGIGLDIKPTPTIRYRHGSLVDDEGWEFVPSVDLYYRLTPSLTAAATFKTDFAEAEPDERELNLSRFDVFYPEKRDFFLQDAGIFEFGGLKRNGRPFFSRRIGFVEETEVPLLAGGKLTGRVGPVSLGALVAKTEETDDYDSAELAVARATLDVLEQSRIGFIATYGDPASKADNSVFGIDAMFRTDRFFGDHTAVGTGWVLRSFTGDPKDDEEKGPPVDEDRSWAYGARFEFPNDPFEFSAAFTEIQENFKPALGFVNRRGIRQYDAEGRYRFKPNTELIRHIDVGGAMELVTSDTDNTVESLDAKLDIVKLTNPAGDSVKLTYERGYEFLEEDEKIAGVIPVSAGKYHTNGVSVTVETSPSRVLSGGIEIGYGEFYDGTLLKFRPTLVWRPNPHFLFGIEYEANRISLPDADRTAQLVGIRAGYYFSPDLNVSALVQYDNLSDQVGVSAGVRWIREPGNEMFFRVDQDYLRDEDDPWHLIHKYTGLALKAGWTLRF